MNAPRTYRPAELPALLGVGPAMSRRYSATLETVLGEKLHRDGRARVYTQEHIDAMLAARRLVLASGGVMPLDAAMRRALGKEHEVVAPGEKPAPSSEVVAVEPGAGDALERVMGRVAASLSERVADAVREENREVVARLENLERVHAEGMGELLAAVRGVLEENRRLREELERTRALPAPAPEPEAGAAPRGWWARVRRRFSPR